MPISTIDPRAALIVIDLQKGILGIPAEPSVDDVIHRASELAAAFRRKGLPVVLVSVTGGAPGRTQAEEHTLPDPPPDWADLVDELDAQPQDHLVIKQTWGAFHNTSLHEYLAGQSVTQVVIAGVSTSIGVESTARSAYEHGYHVVLVTDAMSDLDPDAARNSIERIFPRLGETGTTQEILDKLEG
ncbi:MAG TPA: cysteine hydrolase [Mycobacteriales bacterium]|nr:cysteine hydrolase [Mycobacteriales bacterium]